MSNKENDIIRETAYEAEYERDCDDMAMWALANQIETLRKDMQKDRLQLTAQKLRAKLQQKTIDLQSIRIDKILEAVCLLSNAPDVATTMKKKS